MNGTDMKIDASQQIGAVHSTMNQLVKNARGGRKVEEVEKTRSIFFPPETASQNLAEGEYQ